MSSSRAKASHSVGSPRKVGQHAQLDLRVVGRQQLPARLARQERRANLAAALGAHRNVLQVRIVRAEPARGRHHLVERRVHAAGLRMHHLRQGVDVRVLQLGVLPILDDLGRQRMQPGQLFQHVGVGAAAALGALEHRQLVLVEQDLLQLLGRADVELAAGQLVDLALQLRQQLRRTCGSSSASSAVSILMPLYSNSTSTSTSGISTVVEQRVEIRPLSAARPGSAAAARPRRRLRPRSA